MTIAAWAPAASAEQRAPDASHQAATPRTIALAPGCGELGAAVAAQLKDRGYGVVTFAPVVASMGATTASLPGVDAVLTVHTVADAEGRPQTVTAVMTAPGGQVLARVSWQNYWGGWRGSKGALPNQDRRRTPTQAASEIADDLIRTL